MDPRRPEIERFAQKVHSSKLVNGFVVPKALDAADSMKPWVGNVAAKKHTTLRAMQPSDHSFATTDRHMQKRLTLLSDQITNFNTPISAQISAKWSRADVINRELFDEPGNPLLEHLFNPKHVGLNTGGGLRPFTLPA